MARSRMSLVVVLVVSCIATVSGAVTWDSNTQFSGVQGQSDWFYQYGSAPLRDDDLGYDSSAARWVHPAIQYLWIWNSGAHPGPTLASARNWQSPLTGSVSVTVNLADANPGGGDGVVVSIYRNSLLLWGPTTIPNTGSLPPFTLSHVPVDRGEVLTFRVEAGASNDATFDATSFRASLDGSPNRWVTPGPDGITGAIETASSSLVTGWAADDDAAGAPIYVHVYMDGTFRAAILAQESRPDLVTAGLAPEANHGFSWVPPALDGNTHSVTVYAINVAPGPGEFNPPLLGSPAALNPIPVALGTPREMLGPLTNGLSHFPDAPIGTLTWNGVKHRYMGAPSNHNSYQAIEQTNGSWVVQTTPTLTHGTSAFDDGAWLYDVVNGGTRIRGWYHAEEYRNHSQSPLVNGTYTATWSIGYAESKNADTFTKGTGSWSCGNSTKYPNNRAITSLSPPQLYSTVGEHGVGLPRVIQIGAYYYMYYTELTAVDNDPNSPTNPVARVPGKSGLHVARALVSGGGCPGTWLKWHAGAFSTPGIGGDSDPIIADGAPDQYAAMGSVSWNSWLARYVMVSLGHGGFYLRTSTGIDANGIIWGQPQLLMGGPEGSSGPAVPGKEFLAYPTLLSSTGDVQTTDRTPWLYYMLKRAPDDLVSRTLVRRLVQF